MSDTPKIPIKNIYYMLCYAWNTLSQSDNVDVGSEKFDNIYNLLTRVLINGVRHLLKRGFHREYSGRCEELSLIRGKIDVSSSIKQQTINRQKLICEYDEFTADAQFNRIIKFTIIALMKYPLLDINLKRDLSRLLLYFAQIGETEPTRQRLYSLRYNRNNQHYKLMMNVCELLYNGLISNESGKEIEFSDFIRDRQMAVLYEKFVLNFYKKHLPLSDFNVDAPQIKWDYDEDFDNVGIEYLPDMRTDIVLENKPQNVQLIIDTKYYSSALCKRNYGDTKKLISNNLYQICTYVNNSSYKGEISGMLLYPTTEENLNLQYRIGGKIIMVKTLNLGADWTDIYNRLIEIASVTKLS
jgi:5-methylcytosine-specific restriction enzyme subunit McrC